MVFGRYLGKNVATTSCLQSSVCQVENWGLINNASQIWKFTITRDYTTLHQILILNGNVQYWCPPNPFLKSNNQTEVGGSIPRCEISSLLDRDRKLAKWSTASCALALACWPCVSKNEKKNNNNQIWIWASFSLKEHFHKTWDLLQSWDIIQSVFLKLRTKLRGEKKTHY